ncbi:type II toxin-antitoxin system PemK/MazF family toxin, partial [Candidatus Peregrinibacteria bacterium]|nr:type II toxin-antitoxin system PemK/MazF family toxin [Candidatus Peregrinibacteria bacterium]
HSKKESSFYINVREVWFTKMGQNIGYEENGKKGFERPVLVLKKVGNLFFIVPLTSKGKNSHLFYHKFHEIELQNPKYKNSSYAILSQVKVMDKRRFIEHVGTISKSEFMSVKEKLKTLLF